MPGATSECGTGDVIADGRRFGCRGAAILCIDVLSAKAYQSALTNGRLGVIVLRFTLPRRLRVQ